MKKILALLLVFVLISPPIFAQQNAQTGRAYAYGPNVDSTFGFVQPKNGSNSVQFGTNIIGDSNMIASAFGLQGGGAGTAAQLCLDWGLTTGLCVNKATQSNNAADMAFATFTAFALADLGNPLGVYICCSNEADTGTANTTAQYLGMRQTQEAVMSYMTLGTSERSMSFGTATSLTTFATDSTTFTVSKGVSTATTGSFNQVVNVGKCGCLWGWQYEYASGGGQFQVLDKSVVPAGVALTDLITGSSTLLATSISRAAVNFGATWAGAVHFTGLTPGYHTLTVNVTTSGKVGFIGFGSPSNLKRGAGSPTLIVGNTIREQFDNYGPATIATNANVVLAVTDVMNDGLNIAPADMYDANDAILDYDSKAIIGYQITSQGSGQTNVVGATGSVTGSTCAGGTPAFVYTIAGGLLTSIQPTILAGIGGSAAQGCTVAGTVTISAGGTPATVTPILSTNTNYNAQPPFHLALRGAQHDAQAIESAAQAVGIAFANGCAGLGNQTVNITTRCIVHFGVATDTFPSTAGSMSPGQCVIIQQTSNGAASYTTLTGGSGGNASGKVIGPGGAAMVCSFDNAGNVSYGPESEGANGTGPTMAAGAAAGTAPTCTTIAATQTIKQTAGLISCTTGTATTTGILATITFNGTLPAAYNGCQITPRNTASAALMTDIFTTAPSTTTFTLTTGTTAPVVSTAYSWSFICR